MAEYFRDVKRPAVVTTTNATPTTVFTYPVPSGASILAKTKIIARASDGTSASWQIDATAKNLAGVMSIIGTVSNLLSPQKDTAALLWNATITNSGTDVTVQVTGGIATTINWFCIVGVDVFSP